MGFLTVLRVLGVSGWLWNCFGAGPGGPKLVRKRIEIASGFAGNNFDTFMVKFRPPGTRPEAIAELYYFLGFRPSLG